MPKKQVILLFSSLTFLLIVILLFRAKSTYSALATNVVISEIQIGGGVANDEFVELYNPTGSSVDLTGWRLTRKTSSGTQSNLVASITGSIPAHGFFLIAHPDYDGSVVEDQVYSATSSAIAANNTVVLYSDAGAIVVDKVGMGTTTDVETTATSVPETDGSVERKANSSSTSDSMGSGGADENSGNGEDSGNNSNDFVLRGVSNPQNSSSSTEVLPTSTPTETPTPTLEPSPTETLTPTPTLEPSPTPTDEPSPTPSEEPSSTPTPTPSETPSPTPTEEVTPTPTLEPTATPTEEPSATPTLEPTPTLTLTPTPTPTSRVIGTFNFLGKKAACKLELGSFNIAFFRFRIPIVTCSSL